jgi:hypothetical protein
LQTFDAPNGEAACVRRARSNTPLQALVTLNEPISMECARALGKRIVRDGGSSDEERLSYAFRCCLSRSPTEEERDELGRFFTEQKRRFAAGSIDPMPLVGDAQTLADAPVGVSPAELGAWTATARVLLNLDEVIVKQ